MLYLYSYGQGFLELTFILVSLMLLHRLRQVIGSAPYYLCLGALLVFAQIVTATGLGIAHPSLIRLGPVIFFTPFMALLLIMYIVDGTLEAQRLIWAVLCVVGIFFYLAYLTEKQVFAPFYVVDTRFSKEQVTEIFSLSQLAMMASLLSILVEFLVLPIVYELMRHRRFGVGVSVTCALISTQVIDAFFYQLVTNPVGAHWWESLRHVFIIRAAAMLWVSFLTVTYLKMRRVRQLHESLSRHPLDIITAFVGGYGQAQKLQANVREWEGRYRMVVENAHDLIFLIGENGTILDANRTVVKHSGYSIEELLQLQIQKLIKSGLEWSGVWGRLFRRLGPEHWEITGKVFSCECVMASRQDAEITLETAASALFIRQNHAVLLVARDITERKKLESELAAKQDQFVHAQRMEAVGKLAGGIAHDFNNLLHAIQGSIDNLERAVKGDSRMEQLLSNISTATGQAANLTSQLLGFARGGKYRVEPITVSELVRETADLFRPMSGKRIKLKVAVHPDPLQIEGDYTQLQQVFLNMLINAMEALPAKNGAIVFRAEPATEHTPGLDSRPETVAGKDFVAIRIKDDGAGIDAEIKARIFEPFFTTKKAAGTGMGLAMVYGCIENHNGWIHVASEPGKGTEFFIFLPRMQ